jgi:hypothetical protein
MLKRTFKLYMTCTSLCSGKIISHHHYEWYRFFLYLMRTLMTVHSWNQPFCAKTCWTCLMRLVRICINMVPTLYLMLVIMTHYFVRFRLRMWEIWNFQWFVTKTSNKSLKNRFWKEKSVENVLTLESLPFNSRMILFHTWLFKNGIYLANNVICWFHPILYGFTLGPTAQATHV